MKPERTGHTGFVLQILCSLPLMIKELRYVSACQELLRVNFKVLAAVMTSCRDKPLKRKFARTNLSRPRRAAEPQLAAWRVRV